MRLLYTTELRFDEFFDDEVPDYAIFSHRWAADALSKEHSQTGTKKHRSGSAKIIALCILWRQILPNTAIIDCFEADLNWCGSTPAAQKACHSY